MAAALGFQFFGNQEKFHFPKGENLNLLTHFLFPENPSKLIQTKFTVLSDVQNPLFGAFGAAYVFAAQKGASESDIEILDAGLRNFSKIVTEITGKDIHEIPGSGAAGGLGAGCLVFLNAEICSGAAFVAESLNLEKDIETCDLIITGEGKLDNQSIAGKTVSEITRLAKKFHKPAICVCGVSDITQVNIKKLCFAAVVVLFVKEVSVDIAKLNSYQILQEKTVEIIRNLSNKFLYL
jgi:glycerate kinase